ncbi:MAG: GNAT family N-acetyltransferase [Pirellulaceae bacterium]|nr:GNAT family N-acetyltransferase [Pirellulaceae bacterium]
MASLQSRQLESIDQLRAAAEAWDDLRRRCDVTIPTVRAELVALWLEHFAPAKPFRALIVEQADTGRFVAAIPLVERRLGRLVRCGGLTSNYWSPNGELLLDPEADQTTVLDMLADEIEQLPWPLLWFDMVPSDAPHWRAMVAVLRRRGMRVDVHHRWDVGRIVFLGDVEAYFASRSKNLRRSLQKDSRRLEQDAPIQFDLEDRFSPDAVETRLCELFAIEDRGWKGEVGGSVLQHPVAFEFYRRQARQLAEWGDLRVARLMHGEKTIAFDVGWLGGGFYHSYKVGYDPDYREFGPGHLLRERLVRALAERGDVRGIDFQGPQTEALAAWSTEEYPISRLVIAQRRAAGQALWIGYRGLAPLVRLARWAKRLW